MLQINSEMFAQIMERFDRIERALERMNKLKECLDGDTLLDNYDLCRLLGITKRTLARYRQKKLVTYYMIDGSGGVPQPKGQVIAGEVQTSAKCLIKMKQGLWK